MPDAELFDTVQRLAMALGIGFLQGIERGWRHREAPEGTRAAGLRTHAIIGLLGGACALVTPWVGPLGFAALSLAFGAALLTFKLRESERDNDVSVTGTFAALMVFALGAYCMWGDLRIAAAIGVTLVGLMAFKEALHEWLDRLTWEEIRSALIILAATAIALPLLPDRPLDPWGAINPRELWLLTILVAGASFAGYVAVRLLGREAGLLSGAAIGAVVSSTIVTAELGRRVRAGAANPTTAAAAASLAAAVSIARMGVLIAVAATPVAPLAGPVVIVAAASFALCAGALQARPRGEKGDAAAALRNPLDLKSVAQFALLLGSVIVVGRMVANTFGQSGLLPLAATAGLADVDAVALAAGSLVRGGLSATTGAEAVLVGALMNTVAKGMIGAYTGGWRYAGAYFAAAAVSAAAAAAVWFIAEPALAPMLNNGASRLAGVFG